MSLNFLTNFFKPAIENPEDRVIKKIENSKHFKNYQRIVKEKSNKGINSYFPNKDREHANVILSNLFRNTKKELIIFTKGFSIEIEDDTFEFKKNLEEALKRVDIAKILVEDVSDTSLIQIIKRAVLARPEHIFFKKLTPEATQVFQSYFRDEKLFYFTCGDAMFRIEHNRYKNPDDKRATVNFNDPRFTRSLFTVFNKSFDKAEDISIII